MGTFAKLTVEKDFELRKAVRGAGGHYRVVKNTLAERAAKGTAVEEAMKDLAGVTSIAYTSGDPVALAKALSKYAKDNPEYTFKAGIVEGRVIAIKDIDALASMPSKEEIYSKLLFLMNAPAQRLVTVMNAVGRDLAVVINQGVEKNKFGGAGGSGAGSRSGSGGSSRQRKLRPKHRLRFGLPPFRKSRMSGAPRFVRHERVSGTEVWRRKSSIKIALSVVRGVPGRCLACGRHIGNLRDGNEIEHNE